MPEYPLRAGDGGVSLIHGHDFSTFQRMVSSSFVPLEVHSDRNEAFHSSLRSASTQDFHLVELTAGGHRAERTQELIAQGGGGFFKVSLILEGSSLLIQDRNQVFLRPGDLAVYDTSRPYSLLSDEPSRLIVAMFPKSALTIPEAQVRQLSAVNLAAPGQLGSLAAAVLAQVGGKLDQLAGPFGVRIAHSCLDILSTALAFTLGTTAEGHDPHERLLREIHGYIDHHLASPDLAPGTIAAAHYISTRHLHGLFRSQGVTVAGWIRQQRLARCRRELSDPVLLNRSVASIAAAWGFPDPAHFSRTFKAAFGESPRDFRARLTV
ncbi:MULTISPECIES: helix-turn-helix domain-containing protein [Arthrobacter]|uniref:Helix-turn-helix domain-containing protein n=2 Tax=Arthrobacter TaxID=1663 RepID=A0ABU9KGX4_9MICC|nr:helix-turn-helix domain-containing protein [Arthrobacter sp. YJM1]MDP5225796.1 helix-turn-helix domain-containing protein [Arthrobacter sp. YJM1]